MDESVNTQAMSKRPARKIWNYTPDLPLQLAPYWNWPLKPLASLRYLLRSWNPVAQRFLFLLAAFVVWTWFTPDLDQAKTLAFGWIFEIWLRDLVILLVVAGGLHLALWKYRTQADEYRYDMRPMAKGAKIFTFKNQVWDNMFWTLGPCTGLRHFLGGADVARLRQWLGDADHLRIKPGLVPGADRADPDLGWVPFLLAAPPAACGQALYEDPRLASQATSIPARGRALPCTRSKASS